MGDRREKGASTLGTPGYNPGSKSDLISSESGSTSGSQQDVSKSHKARQTRILILVGVCLAVAVTVAIVLPLVVFTGEDEAPGPQPTTTPVPEPGDRDVRVTTEYGDVIGHYVPVMNAHGYNKTLVSFNSIPFAKPPVGNLRWTKPQDPDPWDTPYVADVLPPLCMQRNLSIQRTHWGWDRFSEDCLYMNILTPLDTTKEPYPVMVYIHGGSYQSNGAIKFPGHFLAERDVVTVIIQYRVGIMGFASTNEPEIFSNFGLWDQIKALQFVQRNIRAFGGDPEMVTVAGNSAGSSSIGLLSLTDEAEGLFKRAIMQSGSELSLWAVNGPPNQPETYLPWVAEQNNCPTSPNSAMIDCLREVDADVLRMTGTNCSFCLGFVPVIDNVLLTDMPRQMRFQGKGMSVDLLAGNNADECNIFLPVVWPPVIIRQVNQSMLEDAFRMAISWISFVLPEDRVEEIIQAVTFLYKPWPLIDDGVLNKQFFGKMCSDAAFHAPTYENLWFNYQHPDKPKTFAYVNNVDFFTNLHPVPRWFGVGHMWELPYIFGYPQLQRQFRENTALAKDTGNLNNPLFQYNRDDELWADYIIDLWTNFIKYGDPTPEPIVPPRMDKPIKWEEYTNEKMEYFYMDNEHAQTYLNNYRPTEVAFWGNYLPNLAWDYDMHPRRDWERPNTAASTFTQKMGKAHPPPFDLGEVMDLSLIDQLLTSDEMKKLHEAMKA